MSNSQSLFFSPVLKKILVIFTLILIPFFGIIWFYWWKNSTDKIYRSVNEKVNQVALSLSKFDDNMYFQSSDNVPVPKQEQNIRKDGMPDGTQNLKQHFDTAYYHYLWEKFIVEYGLSELDSMAIDSMVKREMLKNPRDTNSLVKQHTDKFELKKEEMLKAKFVKPELFNIDTALAANKLTYQNILNQQYKIELWRSPLNIKGVKSLGNIITVYGLDEIEQLKIRINPQNNDIFLVNNKDTFKLKRDGVFYKFSELTVREL